MSMDAMASRNIPKPLYELLFFGLYLSQEMGVAVFNQIGLLLYVSNLKYHTTILIASCVGAEVSHSSIYDDSYLHHHLHAQYFRQNHNSLLL